MGCCRVVSNYGMVVEGLLVRRQRKRCREQGQEQGKIHGPEPDGSKPHGSLLGVRAHGAPKSRLQASSKAGGHRYVEPQRREHGRRSDTAAAAPTAATTAAAPAATPDFATDDGAESSDSSWSLGPVGPVRPSDSPIAPIDSRSGEHHGDGDGTARRDACRNMDPPNRSRLLPERECTECGRRTKLFYATGGRCLLCRRRDSLN